MLKRYLLYIFNASFRLNHRNILKLAALARPGAMLDMGCDDGVWTMQVARAARATEVFGIEIVESRARQAQAQGIRVEIGDLDDRIPFEDGSFDFIHSNQVIEHVSDVDHFAAEIERVLRPDGLAVISTENGSSWHNIAAAIMGWQIFSLTNISKLKAGLGNPLSLLRDQTIELGSWTHKVIFNYRGLREFFELHGLEVVTIAGSGYHPLPPWLGTLDVRHAHWITIAVRKRART